MTTHRQKPVLIAAFCLYIILTIVGVFTHEPWRDEAHTWMSAREEDLSTIFHAVRYNQTPIFWTLILVPFAKLGFPFESMGFIHAGLAITAVMLLLFYSKFPLLTKILLTFSYFIGYEYALVARNYVLTELLLFIIAIRYPTRNTRPLLFAIPVALLFQTNTLSVIAAGALTLLFFFESVTQKRLNAPRLLSLLIMFGAGIITFFMLLPDNSIPNSSLPPYDPVNEIGVILHQSVTGIFTEIPWQVARQPFLFDAIPLLTGASFILLLLLTLRAPAITLLAVASMGWIFYVLAFAHIGSPRHHGLLLIYAVFIWWINSSLSIKRIMPEKILNSMYLVTLNILLLMSVIGYVYMWQMDYKQEFSGAKNIATYLKDHQLTDRPIAAYVASITESVLPYLEKKHFYYPEFDETGYFDFANSKYQLRLNELSKDAALQRLATRGVENPLTLILLSEPLVDPESMNVRLLHATQATLGKNPENYWLYEQIHEVPQ